MEWPARIPRPRVTQVNSVTTDTLPTLCELAGLPLPPRPLDGISLVPVINGSMHTRPSPIFFWSFNTGKALGKNPKPYIDPQYQEGTTPLVKMMAGKYTRSFRNFHYPGVSEEDFGGPRSMLGNRYKLVVGAQSTDASALELFDLIKDPTETHNLVTTHPALAKTMQQQLHAWQHTVLNSLTGADY